MIDSYVVIICGCTLLRGSARWRSRFTRLPRSSPADAARKLDSAADQPDVLFDHHAFCYDGALPRRTLVSQFLREGPLALIAKVVIIRVRFHKELIYQPDLCGCALVLRHLLDPTRLAQGRGCAVSPVQIVKDYPPVRPQQAIDKKKSKPVDKPIVRAIQIAQVE